jgi:hypothetical protein
LHGIKGEDENDEMGHLTLHHMELWEYISSFVRNAANK